MLQRKLLNFLIVRASGGLTGKSANGLCNSTRSLNTKCGVSPAFEPTVNEKVPYTCAILLRRKEYILHAAVMNFEGMFEIQL